MKMTEYEQDQICKADDPKNLVCYKSTSKSSLSLLFFDCWLITT